jgi:DNA-binding NarL/FixJ family response regulator
MRSRARGHVTKQAKAILAAPSRIIAGNGLLAAAARLNITYATAREHAKRILSKTGTTRQTELIRRFFETALLGAPASA